jgi:type IV pilus assembly protein PilE
MKTLPADRNQRFQAGFTLIELMITVVVATILIAVAIPSYNNQMRKSRRTEAKSALLDLASRQERFYSTNTAYTNDAKNLGFDSTSKTLFQYNVGNNYYQVSVCVGNPIPTACNGAQALNSAAANYLIQATPIGTQTADTLCGSFTVDNTGVQSTTGTQTSGCW